MIMQFMKIPVTSMVVEKIFNSFASNNVKEVGMRSRILAILIALVAIMSFTAQADARRFYGACGGGTTLNDAIKGWKAHGVLDDVARSTGQTPGVDGSATEIVKAGIVKTYVVEGDYVSNSTCSGKKFKSLGKKKYIPAGAIYWVPERYAPKPCRSGKAKIGFEGNCGNKQAGKLKVERKCAKPKSKKAKKKRKKPSQSQKQDQQVGGAGNCNSTNAGNVSGPGAVQGSCNQVQVICNGQGSCSPSTTQNSTSYQTCVNNGGVWQGTDDNNGVCNINQESPPPPPPPPPADHAPSVNCANPAHIYVGGNVPMFCSVKDDDGNSITLNVKGDNIYLHISNQVLSNELGCPDDGGICYRVTVWGDQVTPNGSPAAKITATATANGKSAVWEGNFPVLEQPSGGF